MLSQVYEAERATGEKINHIVVMGMGEPFDNYENLKRFLELLHHQDGKNLSYRHMTVSTSGILPGIRQFAEDFPQVNLAVSLHRAEEKGRSEIMPVNRAYPLAELLQTTREYTEKTGRRVTFEYALISGENDRPEDVKTFAAETLRDALSREPDPSQRSGGDRIFRKQPETCRRNRFTAGACGNPGDGKTRAGK